MSNSKVSEIILRSAFNFVRDSSFKYQGIAEYLLEKAKENVEGGRSKWMTNSITGETTYFSDVDSHSRKVASFFIKRGLKKGDKCIYLTSDVTRIFTIIVGIWRAGGCVASSYPEDTPDTLTDRIKDYKAKWVLCDVSGVPQCKSATRDLDWPVEVITFGEAEGCTSVDEIFQDDGSECPENMEYKLDDPALILCTSGTTGRSKGAIYNNRQVIQFCISTDGVPRHNPRPALWLLRCTHVLGVLYPMRNIFVGDQSVMMNQINKENIFKAVDVYKPFLAFGFPLFLLPLATDPEAKKIDLSSIQVVCTGGIVIKEQFYQTMMTLPNIKYVINGFGMTECGAITTTVDISGSSGQLRGIENVPSTSVGKLYPNTMLKILDLETGNTLGPNQTGEMCVSSPILCAGYYNRPDESEKTFIDGWMKTGDLGYYDENGFVFVVDRIKETFKYFNNHISPAELEEHLLQHPSVAEACVFGVKDPDGGDHIPKAIVVLKQGCNANAEEIRDFVDAKVAPYKKIRGGVFLVKNLPRGKTGKVLRSEAAKLPL
ncbi:unnamed protein product [Orchesella dallaii]|uniref:Uncharacterized protein n=1 Tax=Orchesella dallaii TaxID=48710 RepID=A0ABP1Q2T7_9HEXA